MNIYRQLQHTRKFVHPAVWTAIAAVFLAGCINDPGTGALTSAEIEAKQVSHEERYVAGKCNSANRLKSSNLASEVLNIKYTAYGENESGLDQVKKDKILFNIQAQGTKLQDLDQNLKSQCVAYSTCEFQASTTKQDCSIQKHKFLDAETQMTKFTKQVEAIKIN